MEFSFCEPRLPNKVEVAELVQFQCDLGREFEFVAGEVFDACIAVFDEYKTSGPGYAGKVMVVVWNAAPSCFDLFVWQDGRLRKKGREFDDKECEHCGEPNGTLCYGCWKDEM